MDDRAESLIISPKTVPETPQQLTVTRNPAIRVQT